VGDLHQEAAELTISWTDERVELLRKLWSEGLSASRIALELGSVTRNAVIGKVHRLGLSGRAKTTAQQPQKAKKSQAPQRPTTPQRSTPQPITQGATALKSDVVALARPRVEPQPRVVSLSDAPLIERGTILQLTEQTCKWPVGDPGTEEFHFCCRRSELGIPYCGYHARLAYQPVGDRRREKRAAM
jgi:GcrA cell cycle regulator